MLRLVPSVSYLQQKLFHFVVNYHQDWIAQLQIPASNGKYRPLSTEKLSAGTQLLDSMHEVDMLVQLFSAVDIQHRDWLGRQTVHADPFPSKPKTRKVCY
jgi:hypothetical protein